MFKFLKDMIIYPFDKNKKENKFNQVLQLIFKDYPAFLWTNPGWRRAVVFPLLVLAKIFEKPTKNKKEDKKKTVKKVKK